MQAIDECLAPAAAMADAARALQAILGRRLSLRERESLSHPGRRESKLRRRMRRKHELGRSGSF